jgi:hypothetical protein
MDEVWVEKARSHLLLEEAQKGVNKQHILSTPVNQSQACSWTWRVVEHLVTHSLCIQSFLIQRMPTFSQLKSDSIRTTMNGAQAQQTTKSIHRCLDALQPNVLFQKGINPGLRILRIPRQARWPTLLNTTLLRNK